MSAQGQEPFPFIGNRGLAQVRVSAATEAARIVAHLDGGGGDLIAWMPAHHYAMLLENDLAKTAKIGREGKP